MQIKGFTARSTKEVLSMIKAELGPDAVILDTQEEDGLITMTAALERAPARGAPSGAGNGRGTAPFAEPARPAQRGRTRAGVLGEHTEHARTARPQSAPPAAASAPAAAFSQLSRSAGRDCVPRPAAAPSPPDYARRPGVAPSPRNRAQAEDYARAGTRAPASADRRQRQEEWGWSDIRQQLMSIMKPAASMDALPPRQRLAVEFLRREGVEEAALQHICAGLRGDPSASILVPLGGLVPICPWNSDNWPQRMQVIAGPFGAGKTTVAVRLALALRKSRPGLRICLLNADAARGNGRLLLRHYCELSDMAYKEASTTPELVTALTQGLREGFDRIIVDLPGLSRGRCLHTLLDDAGLGDLTGDGPENLAVHLTLSPHYREMRGMMERYRTAHRSGIVWTKLDEVERFGQMVNVGAAAGLPVSALSFGPGLGNSLAPVKENMLWRLIFKREMPLGA